MSNSAIQNLDLLAARTAQAIVNAMPEDKKKISALENMATKALGVLQEQGVYAGLLFLYAKNEDAAKGLRGELLNALAEPEMEGFQLGFPTAKDKRKWQDVNDHLLKICADLDTLLLVKQLWEQTLIYVRYGARAQG
ncbi:MAG: hypothetical protein HY741_18255 [Chloroflexi bacterium]|nr:hypothetical protein [Chloroflexota bacterium]